MILVGNQIYAELKQIDAGATEFTGDIAIQLKAPPSNGRPQHIGEHPGGGDGDARNVALRTEFTAQHHKLKEVEMIRVFGIIVLGQERRKSWPSANCNRLPNESSTSAQRRCAVISLRTL